MRVLYVLVLGLGLFVFSYGQTTDDYLILQLLIQKDKSAQGEKGPYFLTKMNYYKNNLNRRSRDAREMLDTYQHNIHNLFKDTLTQYSNKISKRAIKKAFVHWKAQNIVYKPVIDKTEEDCFYYTRPLFVAESLFVVLSFHDMPGGGISAVLYEWDTSDNSIRCLKYHTQMLIEINFR